MAASPTTTTTKLDPYLPDKIIGHAARLDLAHYWPFLLLFGAAAMVIKSLQGAVHRQSVRADERLRERERRSRR